MLSSSRRSAPASSGRADLGHVPALDLDGQPAARLARAPHRLPHPSRDRRVVLLDQDRVVQAHAVVRPPSRRDRGLLERPQPRGRLARVEDADAGALHLPDEARGQGRDPGEVPQQVERGALARQQGPGGPEDARDGAWEGSPATCPRPPSRRTTPRRTAGTPPPQPRGRTGPRAASARSRRRRSRAQATIASEVTSPVPTSSARARSTTSRISPEAGCNRHGWQRYRRFRSCWMSTAATCSASWWPRSAPTTPRTASRRRSSRRCAAIRS